MPFKLSREAREDFQSIGRYTQKTWGSKQRRQYLAQLDELFALLGNNPLLGRSCDDIRQGYYRFEHASHVIFYKRQKDHVLISRILHKRMDVNLQIKL